ncbi:MAG: efflux RND transporter periplasmic adaptor subunit [Acidobacteriia bacterium]|nr:efflux RND transporter periplasmic adaptor subunit [Terriglobia bacterium]
MAAISKNTQRRWLWILPALLAGVLVLIGGRWLSTTTAQAPAPKSGNLPEAKAPVIPAPSVYTVSNADVTRTILITGELQAARSLDIQAPATKASAANAITFLAEEGKPIKKGEKLVEFDASALLSQMTDQQRQLDEAALGIEKQKKDLEAQRCDLLNSVAQAEGNLKITKLNADIPVELQPNNTYLKYQNDYEKAKLALTKAKEQLANFEANYDSQIRLKEISRSQLEIVLKRMQNDLAILSVDAPQDGVVIYGDNWASNRKYQVGDMAFPGQTIITLPDLSGMRVAGFVYDTELQFLTPGMACEIHLDAVPAKSWRGKIASLTSVAGKKGFATTQKVFKAMIPLDGVDLNVMKPGMTARAEVVLSMAAGVIAIPRQQLALDGQGRYYVLKETGPKTPPTRELVKVGVFGDQMVQILSGVSLGDRLLPVQKTLGE